MTPIFKNNSISDSYNRISGGTPVIKYTGGYGGSNSNGPQFKSKTESALERYAAEKAVMDKEEEDKMARDPMYALYKKLYGNVGNNLLGSSNLKQASPYELGQRQAQQQQSSLEGLSQYQQGLRSIRGY